MSQSMVDARVTSRSISLCPGRLSKEITLVMTVSRVIEGCLGTGDAVSGPRPRTRDRTCRPKKDADVIAGDKEALSARAGPRQTWDKKLTVPDVLINSPCLMVQSYAILY